MACKSFEIFNFKASNGIIFLGDVHEERESLTEIADIFREIYSIKKEYNCDAFFQLGDLCDKYRLDADELYYLTEHISCLKKDFNSVSVIEGNHDKLDKNMAIINYLKFLGVNIFSDEIVIDTKFGKVMLGHWFVDKSKDSFGTHHRYLLSDLESANDYRFGLLGHQHDFQRVSNKTFHLGSARYVSYGEDHKSCKRVAILNEKGLTFKKLNSIIPIYNIDNMEDLKKAPKKAKVRYIFRSFPQLKNEIDQVNTIKDSFYHFKKKLDFSLTPTTNLPKTSAKKTQNEIISSWLSKINDTEIRNILDKEFKKEFN